MLVLSPLPPTTSKPNVYVHAALGREGLGNLLIPWAKAEVFRRDHGVQMLAPRWTSIKVGPVLRRERDKRYYLGLFDDSGYVTGVRRRLILATARKVSGDAFSPADVRGRTLVYFRGCEGGLAGMGPDQPYIRARLEGILSSSVRRALAENSERYEVCAHVRRGDRPALRFGEGVGDSWAPGMPDEWFINCINAVRSAAGRRVPVRVFSDARSAQIDRILALEDVTLMKPNPSIVDMFLMSRCKVLIGTGTSTFSSWSSFLGGALTLYYPGILDKLGPDWPGGSLATSLRGEIDEAGVRAVRAALG